MEKIILTIDDSTSLRAMVRMTLTSAGYQVVEASDGADGLRKAAAHPPDAILTDLNMPGMGGMDFIRNFRASAGGRGVPVVVLTTETGDALKQEARAAGATGWLAKPFDREKLLSVVRKVAGA